MGPLLETEERSCSLYTVSLMHQSIPAAPSPLPPPHPPIKQLKFESLKKLQASTGFEPMTL